MAEDKANGLTKKHSQPHCAQNELPLVSVVIPCYNAEKYVEQAVRSIMNQTYKNLEILITDDCSTDESFAILRRLAEEDSRIKLFQNEQNQKIVRTLNALVERANGKYIARMDADDISLQKRIEKQVAFLEANPDIAICGTNAWHINKDGNKISKSRLPCLSDEIETLLPYICTFYHPTVMAKSEVLKNNPYNNDFVYVEDIELWCRLVFSRRLHSANLSERLFCYRTFDIEQSSTLHSQEQIEKAGKLYALYNHNKEKTDTDFLINIFLTNKNVQDLQEAKFIKSLAKKLRNMKLNASFSAYQRLLSHCLKFKKISLALQISLNMHGLFVIIVTLLGKLSGKRRGK